MGRREDAVLVDVFSSWYITPESMIGELRPAFTNYRKPSQLRPSDLIRATDELKKFEKDDRDTTGLKCE